MKQTPAIETKIVETAKELFVEKGFEETNMTDIAERAGINRPTLHYYFRTKDKMFQAVFTSIVRDFLPKVEHIFLQKIPFMDKVSLLVDAYFDVFKTHPSLPRFILGEAQRDISHLLATVESFQFDKYLRFAETQILKEMEAGNLKKVPIPVVFLTFYGQMVFPFLAKDIMKALFFDNEKNFEEFLPVWKKNILAQMSGLLLK